MTSAPPGARASAASAEKMTQVNDLKAWGIGCREDTIWPMRMTRIWFVWTGGSIDALGATEP